jgi:spermidine/putrescine transport system permease protein
MIKFIKSRILKVISIAVIVYLMIPIIVIIIFSFNKPKRFQNTTWNQFSFDAWTNICRDETICLALGTSLKVGLFVTIVSTVFGVLISFAITRHRFKGRAATNLFVFLPLATPEVILGASLLALFLNVFIPLGFWTILIAQITFTISFVVVVMNARLAGMDQRLEQAAMDLYATPFQTFRYITFPLALPGILAAALISFSLSIDDYIVTSFNRGGVITFPIYIWSAAQKGIPPQVNVISTIMFLSSLLLVLVAGMISKRRKLKHL